MHRPAPPLSRRAPRRPRPREGQEVNNTADNNGTTKPQPRKWLLTQNSQLRKEGIFNWTLPAFDVKLPDGSNFNVCPQAGACASLCYAPAGA
ncbi:hypothetical protein [Streptomyces sp. NPDC046985]|uniref:GP88 family protein n=1 Tax=Streptomyces sp. NPDC046985 TaxID=3155377 RepID=UPI0033ED69F1